MSRMGGIYLLLGAMTKRRRWPVVCLDDDPAWLFDSRSTQRCVPCPAVVLCCRPRPVHDKIVDNTSYVILSVFLCLVFLKPKLCLSYRVTIHSARNRWRTPRLVDLVELEGWGRGLVRCDIPHCRPILTISILFPCFRFPVVPPRRSNFWFLWIRYKFWCTWLFSFFFCFLVLLQCLTNKRRLSWTDGRTDRRTDTDQSVDDGWEAYYTYSTTMSSGL